MRSGQAARRRPGAARAGVVGALVVGEVGMGLLLPPPPWEVLRGLHRAAPGRPWLYELEPGRERRDGRPPHVLYATNADGFRDHAYDRVKPKDAYRIAVVGDSVSFGYGV